MSKAAEVAFSSPRPVKFPRGSCRDPLSHLSKPKGLAAQLRHLWKGVQSWGESDQFWEFTGQTSVVGEWEWWSPNNTGPTSGWKGTDSGRFPQRLDLELQAKEAVATEPSQSLGRDVPHLSAQSRLSPDRARLDTAL